MKPSAQETPIRPIRPIRRLLRRWWVVALVLLALSHAVQFLSRGGPGESHEQRGDDAARVIEMPAMGDGGPVATGTMQVGYLDWSPVGDEARARPPVVLIHGSPGAASNFDRMGPLLAARGWRTIAVDLPGFGASTRDVPSYSILAHAHAVLALLDEIGVERAHVVGWSMGGGVALHMADLEPDRLASLTLMASIGTQANEGSGSYEIEHLKYMLGYAAFVVGPELVPHFGLLDDHGFAHSFLRNFLDSDQRPLRGIMQRVRVPTLVLHGRHDFLVPDWAAESHHRLIAGSRLVMMDSSHFMPFLQPEEATGHLAEFFERHDEKGVAPQGGEIILAPEAPHVFGVVGRSFDLLIRDLPWWGVVLLVGAGAARWPYGAIGAVAVLVVGVEIDYMVGALGLVLGTVVSRGVMLAIGRGRRPARWIERRLPRISLKDWERRLARRRPGLRLAMQAVFRRELATAAPLAVGRLHRRALVFLAGVVLASIVWVTVLLIPLLIAAGLLVGPLKSVLGAIGMLILWAILAALGRNLVLFFSWTSRRQLVAKMRRQLHQEFWPAWVFYVPLVPYLVYLAIRHRHPLVFTACNPGIDAGGGVVGESKHKILSSFASANGFLLEGARIDAPTPIAPARLRTQMVEEAMAAGSAISSFPVILKPDSGFRGFGVKLVRSRGDVETYLETMTRPIIVQEYHPGPHEVGVMWSRCPSTFGGPAARTWDGERAVVAKEGFIYSITRKEFPHVVGDGKRTLEELVYSHPRLRCQAGVFLRRFADDTSRVLDEGERLRLALSGNHCQGTLFRDGSDLITAELGATIDELAGSFAQNGTGAGGLDFGRFDVRYESEDDLRAGRGFRILELNGTTGESTNLYDPDRSLMWSYKVLFGQWRLLYQLGSERRKQGCKVMPVKELLLSLRKYYRKRPGATLAD